MYDLHPQRSSCSFFFLLIQAQAADAGSGQANGDDAARVPAGAADAQGPTSRRRAVSGGRRRLALGRALLNTRYAPGYSVLLDPYYLATRKAKSFITERIDDS